MGKTYLLEVAHLFGDRRVHERTVIEAEDRQMVKYWFHRHYKQFGFTPSWATDKHTIDIGEEVVELEYIESLDDSVTDAADRLLPEFPKV